MVKLSSIIKTGCSPYVPQLCVQVVGSDTTDTRRFAIADDTYCTTCIVYNETHLHKMQEGVSLMILNGMIKKHPNKNAHIEIVSNTRVKLTNKVDVPEHMCERGKELMHVDAADFVEIAAISTSPVKKMVSLRGKIVSEDITKTVQVKGRDVKVKNVTLSDKGSSCRLALWRDQATNSTTAVGDFVEVTNVVVNEFDQSKYVSSTRCTDVKKIDSQIRIIVFEHGSDSKIDLTSDEEGFPTYSIEKETLMQGFEVGEEQNITDLLTERIPFDCHINKNDKGDNTFSLFI